MASVEIEVSDTWRKGKSPIVLSSLSPGQTSTQDIFPPASITIGCPLNKPSGALQTEGNTDYLEIIKKFVGSSEEERMNPINLITYNSEEILEITSSLHNEKLTLRFRPDPKQLPPGRELQPA